MPELSPEVNIAIAMIAAVFSLAVLWWIARKTSVGTATAIVALACVVAVIAWVAVVKDLGPADEAETSAKPPPSSSETAKANGSENAARQPTVAVKPRMMAPSDGVAATDRRLARLALRGLSGLPRLGHTLRGRGLSL